MLVVLDDLQWTDPSSLLLLHYLTLGVQKTPLLLLGAYRSTSARAENEGEGVRKIEREDFEKKGAKRTLASWQFLRKSLQSFSGQFSQNS